VDNAPASGAGDLKKMLMTRQHPSWEGFFNTSIERRFTAEGGDHE